MRIGFIGVGGIATSYMRSLTRLNIPVAAIADLNPERARTVGNEVGSAFFSDHRPMLEQARLDIEALAQTSPEAAADVALMTDFLAQSRRGIAR